MKRKLLLFFAFAVIFCAIFAFTSMADEVAAPSYTYYLVNNEASPAYTALKNGGADVICYKDIIGNTSDSQASVFFGSFVTDTHVEIIFAEDIFVPMEMATNNTGILINTAITVTFRYNGFSHYISSGYYVDDSGQSVECTNNGIVVRHKDAIVRFIGTKAQDLENGGISQEFVLPVIDGENNTYNAEGCNLDAYKTNNYYLQIYKGNAYVEGVRAYAAKSYVLTDGEASGTYEIKNSAFSSSEGYAVQLKATTSKTVKIENCYMKGITAWSVLSGSYVYDSVITGSGVHIDSWHPSGKVWEFENCQILGDSVATSTGRTYLCFTDCIFKENIKWSLSGDNGGNQFLRIYTSPTCTEAGTMEMKQSTNRGGANPYQEEYDNFSAPPLGHTGTAEWEYSYVGDMYLSDLTVSKGCTRCGLWEPTSISINPMFQALGYSVPEFGNRTYIAVGYTADKNAIAQYESISGAKLTFGFAVAAKEALGENTCPLDENGNAISLKSGNVFAADLTDVISNYIEVKLTVNQAHADKEFLITGYVIEKQNDQITVSYVQSNSLVKNNVFEYIAFSRERLGQKR